MAYPTIKKLLSRGPAADNRYQASFTGITAGGVGWSGDIATVKLLNEHSEYLISNMTMPGKSIATGEMYGDRALGVSRKYAHTTMFNEFSMTYVLEAGMTVYQIYDSWMNIISPRRTTDGLPIDRRDIRMGFYNDYIDPKITLKKFERDGSVSLVTEVFNAFPLNLSDLSVSSGSQNGLLEFTVNFAYETAQSYYGGTSNETISGSPSPEESPAAGFGAGDALVDSSKYTDKFNRDYSDAFNNPRNNAVMPIQYREDLITWANANSKMIDNVGTPVQKDILFQARLENAAKSLGKNPLSNGAKPK